jgi:peptidoglycan/xylan/chitin deacetylase (PgdA/CDA1 family)
MILLSFDIEEFDMPFEYNRDISFEDQIRVSANGTKIILDILKKYQIKATFFSTATFAIHIPELLNRIIDEGHELASHTYYHSSFEVIDLVNSKKKLEELSKTEVIGFRMPRMQPVDEKEIFKAGYIYNSSINPTFLPGRYNNLDKPRTYFRQDNVWQIPASVTPIFRFPLFWLSFHNLPLWLYKALAKWTLKTDGYLNIYFHPWEFTNLDNKTAYNFPKYVSKNSGDKMTERLENIIQSFKKESTQFGTFKMFLKKII